MKNNLNIQETVYQFCKLYNPKFYDKFSVSHCEIQKP